MKRQLLQMLFLACVISSYGQQTTTVPPALKTDYLKKSKNQNTTAWVLICGGGVLTSAGLVVGMNEVVHDISNIFSAEEQESSNTGAILFYTGLASMAGSIPFFIISSSNKRKAGEVSVILKIERSPHLWQRSVIQTSYPALSVKLSL